MEIKVPVLGENITTADVTKVLVQAGDRLAKDQPMVELEAEKATLEIPAPAAGQVTQVLVKPGDTVHSGQTILTLEN